MSTSSASRGRPTHEDRSSPPRRSSLPRSRSGATLIGFLAIAGFFLLTEHTAHALGALPYLLLLACPLLHLFMHGGHGGHGGPHDGHRGSQG